MWYTRVEIDRSAQKRGERLFKIEKGGNLSRSLRIKVSELTHESLGAKVPKS